MTAQIGVVTGATSGIGRAVALELASSGWRLELIGRNSDAGERLVRQIKRLRNANTATFHSLDLSNQTEVRRVAKVIRESNSSISLLVNNAGARYDRFAASAESREMTFAGNHLGHFLLTCLLLDRLIAAPTARVVTVSSGSHFGAHIDDGWEMSMDKYNRRQAYARSKLANVMFGYRLAERLKWSAVTSNVVDPGGVASGFARNNGWLVWLRHVLSHAAHRDLVCPRTAARDIVRLCTAPEIGTITGKFFRQNQERESSALSRDVASGEKLWKLSVHLTGLDDANCPSWQWVRPWENPAAAETAGPRPDLDE